MRSFTVLICVAAVAPARAQLVVGIDDFSFFDPVQLVDVNTDSATGLFDLTLTSLTADDAAGLLYATDGPSLYRIPYDTLDPNFAGDVQVGVVPLSIMGLAWRPADQMLYGTSGSSTEEGVYQINPATLQATLIFNYDDATWDFGGFAYDATTDKFYGLNDDADGSNARGLYEINPFTGSITFVIGYPGGETDLDGLAIGGGKAYFVEDQPGNIYVYNLTGGFFETPLTMPILSDLATFSGAAWAPGLLEPLCDGDVDGDNAADLTDLAIILLHFGLQNDALRSDGDLNGDGDVDLTDLAMLLLVFGLQC